LCCSPHPAVDNIDALLEFERGKLLATISYTVRCCTRYPYDEELMIATSITGFLDLYEHEKG
jgi:hypothetical protein